MLNELINKILNSFTKKELAKLLRKQKKVATGKTLRSLKVKGTFLFARKGFSRLITGSSPKQVQDESRSVSNLADDLQPWAQSRGIPETALFSIAKKLFYKGDTLFRTGRDFNGNPPLEVDDVLQDTLREIGNEGTTFLTNQIKKGYEGI